jgi:hypothetical protein
MTTQPSPAAVRAVSRLDEVVRSYFDEVTQDDLRRSKDAAARIIDAEFAELAGALANVLPYAEEHRDEGPVGEDWQSDELREIVARARATLAKYRSP